MISSVASKSPSEYRSFRQRFEPSSATLIIVAESPPISGKYLYDPAGATGELLFNALVHYLPTLPKTKTEGLEALQKRGWILIDATYEPVNELISRARDRVIDRDYPELRKDLESITGSRRDSVPLMLIKANICRLLAPKLRNDGFRILNGERIVPFPSSGQQSAFHRRFLRLLGEANLG